MTATSLSKGVQWRQVPFQCTAAALCTISVQPCQPVSDQTIDIWHAQTKTFAQVRQTAQNGLDELRSLVARIRQAKPLAPMLVVRTYQDSSIKTYDPAVVASERVRSSSADSHICSTSSSMCSSALLAQGFANMWQCSVSL